MTKYLLILASVVVIFFFLYLIMRNQSNDLSPDQRQAKGRAALIRQVLTAANGHFQLYPAEITVLISDIPVTVVTKVVDGIPRIGTMYSPWTHLEDEGNMGTTTLTNTDMALNALEKEVLEWYVQEYKDENLTAQIKELKLVRREQNGAGEFLYFDIPKTLKPIDSAKIINYVVTKNGKKVQQRWPIDGPLFESEDIDQGGGSVLWGKNGYIDTLELFNFGEFFNDEIKTFTLTGKIERVNLTSQ